MDGSEPEVARIELKLRDIRQLFHTLDPSPFRERSLDQDAEAFIASWARDLPAKSTLELIVHVSGAPDDAGLLAEIEPAVRSHFRYLAEVKEREFRRLMSRGRTSLVIGLAFLGLCIVVGNTLDGDEALPLLLRESLLIGGWVAMWRPLEIFLYDWWEVRDLRRDFERLSRMAVRVTGPA